MLIVRCLIRPLVAATLACALLLGGANLLAEEIETPRVTDERLEMTLVAAEPDIVTPIGIAVDEKHRIFVIESHTHHSRPDYPGPKSDRVKLLTMRTDGTPDQMTVFAEGFRHAMNLAFSPDGTLYLVHRNGVIILRDSDDDGLCDEQEEIVRMETPGTYPHNGLSGIAFGADGWLYLGTGENLGEAYTLHGSDDSSWRGTGGDGANVFRCRLDGSRLELFARGAWNLFALEFDRAGNLLGVDNDPDGRPPCRLLHLVQGGDYGYRFRFGRHGQHPFQAWDGELPGTLPMMAGTGEAPSAIWRMEKAALPAGYQDALLVTSWGDHRLELFRSQPHGASFRAEMEVLAEGNQWFRPVGIATAPDGTIYVSDWVDTSYPVHGKGRIWRLRAKPGVEVVAPKQGVPTPKPTAAQQRMAQLLATDPPEQFDALQTALVDDDPFIQSAAIHALARPAFHQQVRQATEHADPRVRQGTLLALRRAAEDWEGVRGAFLHGASSPEDEAVLRRLVRDPDPMVRYLTLAWIGEAGLVSLAGAMDAAFTTGAPSAQVFEAYIAAAEQLADPEAAAKGVPVSPHVSAAARAKIVEEVLLDPAKSAALRAMALVKLSAEQRVKLAPQITELLSSNDLLLQTEAVRTFAESPARPETLAVLKRLAHDAQAAPSVRAEVVLTLARWGETSELQSLLQDGQPAVRREAERVLLPVARRETTERPATDDAWHQRLTETGDADSGRRVFFGSQTNCSNCHRVNGRGETLGPDLSTIARSANREKLITSILDPSREIGPLYAQHLVETTDGKIVSGIWVNKQLTALVLATEKEGVITIPDDKIESHTISRLSLMPEDLEQVLTVEDFRDLLAFLESLK